MERIQSFLKHKIGMKRDGKVYLQDHNEHWKQLAEDEILFIETALLGAEIQFFHIGSSAIPEIKAKPILDLLGECSDLTQIDRYQKELESLGYEYKGEYGIPGRRYCVLYNPEKDCSFVHLHIFEKGSKEAKDHLLFVNYLRAHPEKRMLYEQKKIDLMIKPRDEYTNGKGELIQSILKEAAEE